MEYAYNDASPAHTASYLLPTVLRALSAYASAGAKVFELGCGNGSNARSLAAAGFDVTAVDPSESGIEFAKTLESNCRFEIGSAYDDLPGAFGSHAAVVSLEVVEHLYEPVRYARTVHDLLVPGGVAIISTPYHGYLKNVLIAAAGKWDSHHSPLWDGGHIKFWSRSTLRLLFEEVGMREVSFTRVGRVPPLAKSMVGVFQRD
jgi:2-polyprenyl-6-hydroxyphenyl methylase/3-demethylubiquinone-9 3-methyltransferase